MNRTIAAIVGIAILAGLAIWLGGVFLHPAKEQVEAQKEVLSGAYEPRCVECRILADSELPEDIEPPGIGDVHAYLLVVLLFPQRADAPDGGEHALDQINGAAGAHVRPLHVYPEVGEEGAYLELIYRVDALFERARVVAGDRVVVDEIVLQ